MDCQDAVAVERATKTVHPNLAYYCHSWRFDFALAGLAGL